MILINIDIDKYFGIMMNMDKYKILMKIDKYGINIDEYW